MNPVHIIGGGMAGSEAAWQLASMGIKVNLYEMRPTNKTFAHRGENLAELVCSNSFRSDDHTTNAVGLLHWEMRQANGLVIHAGDKNAIPAGGALAVDRESFSKQITQTIEEHPNINLIRKEVTDLDLETWENVLIATGPLTSKKLTEYILKITGVENLAFFDAIAPIIHAESIDLSKAWFQSRYDKGETELEKKAYLNCPMSKEEYQTFVKNLIEAEKVEFHEWEKETPYFNGCLPIEVMAERGKDTLRFGPMKPVGLTNPKDPKNKPYAVVQLRHENKLGTLFNMVGFQTKMKYKSQIEMFRKIPGLEKAEFARLGGIHRNTFINSPQLLNSKLQLQNCPKIRFAGQITGVEGYVESAAIGLLAGRLMAADLLGIDLPKPPIETAIGSLHNHIIDSKYQNAFQPMNINFGLFPSIPEAKKGRRNKRLRYKAYTDRAKISWLKWLKQNSLLLV